MKRAIKVKITESVVYEVGQDLKDKGIIDHIDIIYPVAKVYVQNNAVPVVEAFLQKQTEITWVEE